MYRTNSMEILTAQVHFEGDKLPLILDALEVVGLIF
jgi:hypothetical protein